MAATTSNELYAPEVWEDIAQGEFLGKAVLINAAVVDDQLAGNPGDTIEFPKWDTLGELDDLTEGAPLVPVKLGQSATKVTIKETGKAVEITDKARLTGLGDPQGEAIRQFGVAAARKADAELIAAAIAVVTGGRTRPDGSVVGDSAPLTVNSAATKLSYDVIVDGTAAFGDDYDSENVAGLYVRSDAIAALHKDSAFIAASTQAGVDVVGNGYRGTIHGMSVFVTDRLPVKTSLIVLKGALGLKYKARPKVEQDRDVLSRTDIVTTTQHLAAGRLVDRGVCVIKTA